MSQKSITSFFKRASNGMVETDPKASESPIKKQPGSAKRKIESSDDEDPLNQSASMKMVAKQRKRIVSSDEESKSPIKPNIDTSPIETKHEKSTPKKSQSKESPKQIKNKIKTPVNSINDSPRQTKTEKLPSKTSPNGKEQTIAAMFLVNPKNNKKKENKEELMKMECSKETDTMEAESLMNTNSIGPSEKTNETTEDNATNAIENKCEDTSTSGKEILESKLELKERKIMQLGKPATNVDEEAAANYNPSKSNYDPMIDAFWSKHQSTPYLALARTFQVIEETSGRLKMLDILSNFFCSVIMLNPKDLLPCVYLSINQIAPAYEGLELGVAEHSLMKVICAATGRNMQFIKNQTHETGDLGLVAEQSRVAQRMMFRPAPLTVQNVFAKLRTIAKTTGPQKSTMIQDIFVACRLCEARFFIRSLIGKLRIGIAEQSLLSALAIAVEKRKCAEDGTLRKISETTLKSRAEETGLVIKTAFCQCPNYEKIIPALLDHGVNELLERCPMVPGMPLKPMLAQPTKGVQEVLERFDGLHITCEWKYDGERAQIHCDEKGVINIYSRNQENNTSKYPDVIARIKQFKMDTVTSYILDSEIVAWDVAEKQILPFQVLSTRKRKNVDVNEIKVQVCVYAFDLLYLNGKPLVTEPFLERRRLMKEHFVEVEGEWQFATALDTGDMDD